MVKTSARKNAKSVLTVFKSGKSIDDPESDPIGSMENLFLQQNLKHLHSRYSELFDGVVDGEILAANMEKPFFDHFKNLMGELIPEGLNINFLCPIPSKQAAKSRVFLVSIGKETLVKNGLTVGKVDNSIIKYNDKLWKKLKILKEELQKICISNAPLSYF